MGISDLNMTLIIKTNRASDNTAPSQDYNTRHHGPVKDTQIREKCDQTIAMLDKKTSNHFGTRKKTHF